MPLPEQKDLVMTNPRDDAPLSFHLSVDAEQVAPIRKALKLLQVTLQTRPLATDIALDAEGGVDFLIEVLDPEMVGKDGGLFPAPMLNGLCL